ncbi:hypothetical protein F4780DRAFT_781747 [Xylariomycetidae sp. FL0641]|nr:hypothetical protein F4780DRAFT_781747 [Xylariomycetidae sp. FL0641]
MVSLWPFKGQESFEKTLSTLSSKINNTHAQLERARSNSRRIRVLWTLYLAFAYLVYAIVLLLVVGWQDLGPWDWTGIAGGPVVIYLVRTLTNAYFSFRIETLESRLKERQAERDRTIQKLKEATKYDSTLELLSKYGGSDENHAKAKEHEQRNGAASRDSSQHRGVGKQDQRTASPGARTHLPPPPTANIQRPTSPLGMPQHPQGPPPGPPAPSPSPPAHPSADFAPNAGPPPLTRTYSQYEINPGPPRWYDRILDLMLGEDEMAPKNRIVLICSQCRLVNGQAPPGTRSLSEIGTWKCMSCGAANGGMDEGKRIIREVLDGSKEARSKGADKDRDSDGGTNDAAKTESSE